MAIIVNLDMMLAKRKMTSLELANRVGMTPANLSILKTGKAKAVRMHHGRHLPGAAMPAG